MLEQGRQLEVTRKLLKLAIKAESIRFSTNELKRRIHDVAKQIGESPEDVGEIIAPIHQELFDEMWERGNRRK